MYNSFICIVYIYLYLVGEEDLLMMVLVLVVDFLVLVMIGYIVEESLVGFWVIKELMVWCDERVDQLDQESWD